MKRRRCLPVAPSAERVEVIHVRYCTGEGTEAEPAHMHDAYYSLDGELLTNHCNYWPSKTEEVR